MKTPVTQLPLKMNVMRAIINVLRSVEISLDLLDTLHCQSVVGVLSLHSAVVLWKIPLSRNVDIIKSGKIRAWVMKCLHGLLNSILYTHLFHRLMTSSPFLSLSLLLVLCVHGYSYNYTTWYFWDLYHISVTIRKILRLF